MKRNILTKSIIAAELDTDLAPSASIIELTDNNRVLIERHLCITEYTTHTICVRMKFGNVQIEGMDLMIDKMCKDQLVVSGQIYCIHLLRDGENVEV